MYKINRDGVINDKIMQTIFKISYLFLRLDWNLYKKEVKFRYQEGCATRVRPSMKLKPWRKHFPKSKNAFSFIGIPVIY